MDPWVEALLKRLEELRNDHVNHLSAGSVASHDEYRHICGIIRGISIVELEIKELTGSNEDFDRP